MNDKKYIYESPDGGVTVTKREFNAMDKEAYYGVPEDADATEWDNEIDKSSLTFTSSRISSHLIPSSSVISSSSISNSTSTIDSTWIANNGKGYSLEQIVDRLVDRLESIEKRLTILTPDDKLLEKYELLQGLYDQYKAAEALLYDNDN